MGPVKNLCLLTLLFLGVLSQTNPISAAEDAIVVGETLTGTQTKSSPNGVFELGFFKLKGTENWYVGILYAQFSNQTVAWLINQVSPLKNNSAVLNLTENGSLVLSYGSTIIWTSSGASKPASTANVTNEGNLAVFGAQNKSEILWESFDHPQNTMLPGMKISATHRLTSWKSPWDPTPGLYNYLLDAPNDQLILQGRNSVQYCESGSWNGQIFIKLPAMSTGYMYQNYIYSNNGTYKYFMFTLRPEITIQSRFVMSESGDVQLYAQFYSQLQKTNAWTMFWAQPPDKCEVYAACGAFGSCTRNNLQFCSCLTGFTPRDEKAWQAQAWSGGCRRRTSLDCSNTSTDGFMELTGKSFPAAAFAGSGLGSAENCRGSCLGNCSCAAYAYDGGDCKHWADELLNLVDSSSESRSIFFRLAAVDVPAAESKEKSAGAAVIGGAIGGGVALLGVGFLIFFFICRRRSPLQSAGYSGPLTVYSYKELQSATKNFSERLGGGGFGSVFKGCLGDKTKTLVAVKKLEGFRQGEKQFRMEVSTIGIIQHVNLIRLRGFCSEGSNRMLVYDYLPNGSLDKWLFSKNESAPVLDWKTRFGIALGMARGILYLHEKCRDCIIHCDIKPENILLDGEFCPKVADFGLSKLMGREFSHVLTTMRGTRGYLAPEWISGLPITPKADVYSFGMTLLEIIAGQRNMEENTQNSEWFFPTWAATQINQENTMELLDEKLNNNFDAEQLKRVAMVGGWCIQDNEDMRPSMSQVVQILEGITNVTVPPIPSSLEALVTKSSSLIFYWDKETTPRSNSSSSTSSNILHHSGKGSENFSNSLTSISENGNNHTT